MRVKSLSLTLVAVKLVLCIYTYTDGNKACLECLDPGDPREDASAVGEEVMAGQISFFTSTSKLLRSARKASYISRELQDVQSGNKILKLNHLSLAFSLSTQLEMFSSLDGSLYKIIVAFSINSLVLPGFSTGTQCTPA